MSNFVPRDPPAPIDITDGQGAPYRDKRSAFFRECFASALPYEEYLSEAEARYRDRWRESEKRIVPSPPDASLLQSFVRKVNVIVLSGIWCGDCARQGPMFRAIELAAPVISCRFLENRNVPELQEELRINGAEKVPVLVALSEDFFEIERFGDRHLSVYRRRAKTELAPACDAGILPPTEAELAQELSEWVRWFERIELLLRLSPMLRRRYGD